MNNISKINKILWKLVAIFLALGAVLMAVGFALGGSTYAYFKGGKLMSSRERAVIEERYGDLSRINLDIRSSRIEVIQADFYGFEIVNDNTSEYEYSEEGGTLTITEKSKNFSTFSIGLFMNLDFGAEVKIYVDRNGKLDELNIKNKSGSITCDVGEVGNFDLDVTSGTVKVLNCTSDENINVKVSSGTIRLTDCAAERVGIEGTSGTVHLNNIKGGDFDISVKSGSFNAKEIEADGFKGSITSGTCKISGELRGDTKINTTSGGVTLNLKGKKSDYNVYLDTKSGTKKIDGENTSRYQGANAEHTVDLYAASGSVRVNFE